MSMLRGNLFAGVLFAGALLSGSSAPEADFEVSSSITYVSVAVSAPMYAVAIQPLIYEVVV